jgi:hypothetical protein
MAVAFSLCVPGALLVATWFLKPISLSIRIAIMSVHALIDESRRGQLYRVAVTVAKPGDLRTLRRALRGMLLPGAREVHFRK